MKKHPGPETRAKETPLPLTNSGLVILPIPTLKIFPLKIFALKKSYIIPGPVQFGAALIPLWAEATTVLDSSLSINLLNEICCNDFLLP